MNWATIVNSKNDIVPQTQAALRKLKELTDFGVDVASFATGGDGSSGSPWTGWDTAITWLNNVLYRFRAGYFAYATAPLWGDLQHSRFLGDQQGGTVLKFTGSGTKAVSFTSTGGGHTQGIVFENFLILGNGATTTYGLYCEAVHRSIFRNVRIDNVNSFSVYWKFGILNLIEHVGASASWQGGLTRNPAWVFATDLRNSGETFQENTILNIMAEGGTAGGILLSNAWQNKITGTSESNPGGKGIIIDGACEGNIVSLNVEDNGNTDFEIHGHRNILLGCISASIASSGAAGTLLIKAGARSNRVIGGRYNNITVESTAVETRLEPDEMRGTYTNNGTLTRARGPWWTGSAWLAIGERAEYLNVKGEFFVDGSVGTKVRAISGSSGIGSEDATLIWTASGADATASIANAASALFGRKYTIKNNYASSHNVIIDPAGSETIDGNTTLTLTPGQWVVIQSDGANWWVIDRTSATGGAITGSGLTMATARLLGRTSASTGAVEEISVGAGLSLSAGALTADAAAWSTYSPTVSASSGTITSATVNVAKYKQVGKIVWLRLVVTITTNGTGASGVLVTLPVNAVSGEAQGGFAGKENQNSGLGITGVIQSGNNTRIQINTTAGGYPATDGSVLVISGFYEVP